MLLKDIIYISLTLTLLLIFYELKTYKTHHFWSVAFLGLSLGLMVLNIKPRPPEPPQFVTAMTMDNKPIEVELSFRYVAVRDVEISMVKKNEECTHGSGRRRRHYPCEVTYERTSGIFANYARTKQDVQVIVNPENRFVDKRISEREL